MKTYAIAIGKSAAANCQFKAEGFTSIEEAKESAKEFASGRLAQFVIVENDEWQEGEWDRAQVAEGWHDSDTMEQGEIVWVWQS